MMNRYLQREAGNIPLVAALGAAAGLYLFDDNPAVIGALLTVSASFCIVTHGAARAGSPGRPARARAAAPAPAAAAGSWAPASAGSAGSADPSPRIRVVAALSCAMCVGIALGGGVRLHLNSRALSQYVPVSRTQVRSVGGTLLQDGRRTESGQWMTRMSVSRVHTASGSYDARFEVTVFTPGDRPSAGRGARFVGELERSEPRFYFSAVEPGDYDAASPFGELRTATAKRLEAALSELGPSAGLARALLLGRRDGLSSYTQDLFRKSGTSHVLALSGMHLGILIGMTLLVLSRLVGKRRALCVALALTAGYLFVVGFRASLVRAAVMFAIVVAAVLLDRKPEPLRILSAAFVLVTVTAPASVDGLSFQLSFAALLGIIVFGRWLDRLAAPWMPRWVRSPLAASFGAQLTTMPLVLSAFGTARPVGIIATLAVAPLAVAFVWVSVVGVMVALVGGGPWAAAGGVTGGGAAPAAAGGVSGLLLDSVRGLISVLEASLVAVVELFADAPGFSLSGTGPIALVATAICAFAALVACLDLPPRARLWGSRGPAGPVRVGKGAHL